ncbi:hypothetical protein AVEN_195543-1 [Araneus ventricosus]|uniref:Uncharacterized protein n=1 Tax=Araneus ventricosus TaxID=182803 RepID=A0A4Y2ETN7_ARAVE|nr:hypothetical protein AVEN_195543-1 [Araneus ventricosus]
MPIRGFISKVEVPDELIPVNPDTTLKRISLLEKSHTELQKYFEFELAPFPLPLFDEGELRKTRKLGLYDLFSTATDVHFTSACYVVHDAFLLHRVLQEKEPFPFILKRYVDYAKKHFNEGATIVSDGYPEDTTKSTKLVERIRRTKKYIAGYVMFDESMSPTMLQDNFLSNDKNKRRLINMLCVKFQKEGIFVKQVEEDSDYLIIKSALEIEKRSQCAVVVCEDICLLRLSTIAAHEHSLRAYLQVQLWSGFTQSPIDCGWKETKHGLFPTTTYKTAASPALLSMISCKCEKGRSLTYTCRKSGIKLSTICYHCKGQGCTNSPEDNIITNSVNQEAEIFGGDNFRS